MLRIYELGSVIVRFSDSQTISPPSCLDMKVYFLTRSSLPAIQDGQMKTVLLCLQPQGTKKTLDQLVRECLKRNYAMTFKQVHEGDDVSKFTASSILYHLDRMGSLVGSEETK